MCKSDFKSLLLVLAFGLMITGVLFAQEDAETGFQEAYAILDNEGYQRHRQALLQIHNDFPGTEWGARALFEAAFWTEIPENLEVYRDVIDLYPGTDWAIAARISILEIEHLSEPEVFFASLDQLAQEFGGPSFEVINSSDSGVLARDIKRRPLQEQRNLYHTYKSMWVSLAQTQGEYEGALPLALFLRDSFAFAEFSYHNETAGIVFSALGHVPNRRKLVDPTVTFEAPGPGGTYLPTDSLVVSVERLSPEHDSLDISAVQLLLDGENVRSLVSLESSVRPDYGPNTSFERLRLIITPETPLGVGVHTLSIDARAVDYQEGPGRTAASWTFIVTASPGPQTGAPARSSSPLTARAAKS